MSRLSDDICSCLSIENRDGDVVISAEVEGELESLNFGKRDIQDIRDSLKILRYFTRLVIVLFYQFYTRSSK